MISHALCQKLRGLLTVQSAEQPQQKDDRYFQAWFCGLECMHGLLTVPSAEQLQLQQQKDDMSEQ